MERKKKVTKVSDFDAHILVKEQIFWFQIAMTYLLEKVRKKQKGGGRGGKQGGIKKRETDHQIVTII